MQLLPNAKAQFIDSGGQPLANGTVGFYFPGTLNPKATYQDAAGTIANPNPVPLDSRGQALIWGSGVYRQILKDASGVTIWDQITEDPNSGLTGNIADAVFVAGPDFTPGTTTQLTLPAGPGSITNTWIFFDAAYQDDAQATVNGTTLTFASPIPVGVGKVTVKIGTTIAIGTPGNGTVTDPSVATGSKLSNRINDVIYIDDGFGVAGNGVANDSAAILAAFNFANGRLIYFKAGTYLLGSDVVAPAGSRAYFQTGVAFTGTGALKNVCAEYETGEPTATAGSIMKIDRLWETTGTGFKAESVGGIWSTAVYAGYARSKTFVAADGGVNSPCMTDFNYAVNNGSASDVCAGIDVAIATNNGSKTVFGRNIIAGTNGGVTNAKMVGVEIDIEPTSGDTSNGTGGAIYVNGFNASNLGPVMQWGGIGGASFNNGILCNGVAGSMFAMNSGAVCASFIDTSNGGFTGQAINLGNQHGITYRASGGGVAATCFADTGSNFNISLGSTALLVNGSNTTEGSTIAAFRDNGAIAALSVFVARGAGPNAANAAVKINGQSVTSRSINAGGTINASGADYAEYELKREDCGELVKGQIVGFDANGLLTDKFSLAVSFGIKSTAPNLVGGDTWAADVGAQPESPIEPALPIRKLAAQTNRKEYAEAVAAEQAQYDAAFEVASAAYVDAKAQYEADRATYEQAVSAWEAKLEAARAKVDRIAYCGKVPVNVMGAKVGQYLVPVANVDAIAGQLVDESTVTFEQYRKAIGQVRKILADGRAEVVVKVS